MTGMISSSPWEAETVVASAPAVSDPCTAPATPPSDCIWLTRGTLPQMFFRPAELQASQISAIGVDGVMG